jgi:DNA-binding HxlR family transcriptional regulator
MRRKSLKAADCPAARALDVIGDWWSLLIVRDAQRGMRRFGEFQKNLGVSKNILTRRLRSLVAQGILDCTPASDGGAYQDYVLTEKGRALFTVIVALRDWGAEHCFAPGECRNVLVDRETGRPVRKLEVHADDGRPLRIGDTVLKIVR